jgi:YesN/AraC family two-component response regulator
MVNNCSILEKIRMFYFSTTVPIRMVDNNMTLYSLPDEIKSITNIVKNNNVVENIFKNINSYNDRDVKTYYITNEYFECFNVLSLDDKRLIIVGPFLKEKIMEGDIKKIIRMNKLSITLKNELIEYYNNLRIIDSTKYYYSGKLLEYIFSENNGEDLMENSNEENFIPEQYFIETVQSRENIFYHPPYFLEQQLASKIKMANFEEALLILKEINSLKRAKLSSNECRSIKNSLIGSITIFTRAAIEGGVESEAAYNLSDYYIHKLEEINNVHSLVDLEYSILKGFIQMVKNYSTNKYSNVVKEALLYIYKNLTEQLSLKKIAEAVYIHPNYLSSLFKKQVGMSISECIMKKKIEESKYYIRFTNNPIIQIASFYGFCNQSYFTQIFKKYTGTTPYEYRINSSRDT